MAIRAIILFTLIISSFQLTAQSDFKLALDSIVQKGLNEGIPGMQIMISTEDSTVSYHYGHQDVDNSSPMNDSTIWRYGSITKIFTAVVILQLESEGKLKLTDPISKHLNLPFKTEHPITLQHLLNHTSGLYSYTSHPRLSFRKLRQNQGNLSMLECANLAISKKPYFTPGEKFRYCNTGYTLLGLIIEKITQQSIATNFEERIFKPCKLNSMHYAMEGTLPANSASGYIKKRRKYIDYTNIHHGWANAAGAIYGTLDDLNTFNECIHNGTLLDSSQIEKMTTPTISFRPLDAEGLEWFDHSYGIGYFLNQDTSGKTIYVSHGGNTMGYNVDIHHNLENKLTITLGMNLFPNGKYKPVISTQNAIIELIHQYHKNQQPTTH